MNELELRCKLCCISSRFETWFFGIILLRYPWCMYHHKSYCISYSSYLVQVSLLGIVYAHTLHFQVPDQECRLHSHHHCFRHVFGVKTETKLTYLLWILFLERRRFYNFGDVFWYTLLRNGCNFIFPNFGDLYCNIQDKYDR